MTEESNQQDEMRLCPTCRMPISVLATRCRYCGETVGRPRSQEQKFTLDDLGGESSSMYKVSGSVTSALEAFREEQQSAREREERERLSKGGTWLGRRRKPPAEEETRQSRLEMPEMNESTRELMEATSGGTHSQSLPPSAGQAPAITRKLFMGAAVAAGLVLLYIGSDFAFAYVKTWMGTGTDSGHSSYQSRALEMLSQGRPGLEALEEAVAALRKDDSGENQIIAREVRSRMVQEVRELLNQPRWNKEQHNRASLLVSQALRIDSSPLIQSLMEETQREIAAYTMVLMDADPDAGTATFKTDAAGEITVSEGDYLLDRFLVKDITPRIVYLEDAMVQGVTGGYRELRAHLKSTMIGG
jgi:ribosomal protein L40E